MYHCNRQWQGHLAWTTELGLTDKEFFALFVQYALAYSCSFIKSVCGRVRTPCLMWKIFLKSCVGYLLPLGLEKNYRNQLLTDWQNCSSFLQLLRVSPFHIAWGFMNGSVSRVDILRRSHCSLYATCFDTSKATAKSIWERILSVLAPTLLAHREANVDMRENL